MSAKGEEGKSPKNTEEETDKADKKQGCGTLSVGEMDSQVATGPAVLAALGHPQKDPIPSHSV